MQDPWAHQLEQWREFFLLMGTAGVTLTGLLFVVISIGPRIVASHNGAGVRAFVSPNAVYFTNVLVVSAALMAPGITRDAGGWLLFGGAALSVIYLASTRGHRRWRQNGLPVLDWVWFVGLPFATYALAGFAGADVLRGADRAFGEIGAAMVLWLVIGIRNAWDLALWIPQQERKL